MVMSVTRVVHHLGVHCRGELSSRVAQSRHAKSPQRKPFSCGEKHIQSTNRDRSNILSLYHWRLIPLKSPRPVFLHCAPKTSADGSRDCNLLTRSNGTTHQLSTYDHRAFALPRSGRSPNPRHGWQLQSKFVRTVQQRSLVCISLDT